MIIQKTGVGYLLTMTSEQETALFATFLQQEREKENLLIVLRKPEQADVGEDGIEASMTLQGKGARIRYGTPVFGDEDYDPVRDYDCNAAIQD